MIEITTEAKQKIKEILAEEKDQSSFLRVFVQGGGCSGMQYGFTIDTEINEDDFQIDCDGMQVLVDSMSGQYLNGAVVDYRDDIYGSSFTIKNPNAETTCGCGSSFTPY